MDAYNGREDVKAPFHQSLSSQPFLSPLRSEKKCPGLGNSDLCGFNGCLVYMDLKCGRENRIVCRRP
ncbi:hypothetical protein Pfo_006704 [Paulownia fortunei]|nr:hypothetical protein Pfo_006704 [Paulownia fortunei]